MRAALLFGALALPLPGQGILDLLDGETLYQGGFLATLGHEVRRGDTLRRGTGRAPDPQASHELFTSTTLALQYGLRRDLQIGVALPWVARERDGIGVRADTDGLGDCELLAKWRFARWDAPGKAWNFALLGELSVPTGEDDVRESGVRLEPELQPGSGGFDPALGIATTYEPGRWRFNAAARYRWRTDSDDDETRLGDDLVAELAAGNRFWLEPYPGPFMRADFVLRWYHEDDARFAGSAIQSGSERATVGFNLAFRPQPALDLQVGIEIPYWQRVSGTQLGEDGALDLTFGYRF